MLKKKRVVVKKRKASKKAILSKPRAKVKKAARRRKIKKPSPPISIRENVLVFETAIQSAKYPSVAVQPALGQMPQELPGQYGQDKITVLVRDPRWIYVYWEITPQSFDRARKQLGEKFTSAKMALRVYDVSNIVFNGLNAHHRFDVPINAFANSCYIETAKPGKSFCVDIGYLLPGGDFLTLARSNAVRMPLEGPSQVTDEEWMAPEEIFARLYGMGFGLGQSSPIGKAWQERIKHVLSSGKF